VRRMQEIDKLLRVWEGQDQVALYIPNGIGIVRLRSHRGVTCSRELIEELSVLVGDGQILVD